MISKVLASVKSSNVAIKLGRLRHEVALFYRQCLADKKIVVISNQDIISIPISRKVQSVALLVLIVCMLWVSYSTGRYFAYETIIEEKDREIWTTSMTNENLQYQVADLHDNLKELNRYFSSMQRYDQANQKQAHANKEQADASASVNQGATEQEQEDSQAVLIKIREKVVERIASLESVIDMTGVKIHQVAQNNAKLRQVIQARDHQSLANGQGGPYIPITGDAYVDKKAFESEIDYLLELEKIIHSFPLIAPLSEYRLSSSFGRRVDPVTRRMAWHSGLDLVGRYGAKVRASAPGKVIFAGRKGAYGKYVEISHGSGITTRYGHLNQILVKPGDNVTRGQALGLQGNTGRSTGSHLHYEVRLNKKAIDPRKFLKAGSYVF